MTINFKQSLGALLVALALQPAQAITRQQLAQYAQSLKGLKKADLKTAAYQLMDEKTVLGYGSGTNKTWWGFYVTDRTADNECINRYSDDKFYFTTRGKAISGMNIEHSFPKSWWGGSSNDAYKDLFNLYPSDSQANSSKSNYIMGEVNREDNYKSEGEGYDIVGKGYANGQYVNMWEPGDPYKGDFCRSYMYMATTYQDFKWQSEGAKQLTTGAYPTLQQWSYELFLKWSKQDLVDKLEIDRNDAVYSIQGNRNLFVDFPYLCEYIWGDSVNVAFDPALAISTASDDARYTGELTPTDPTDDPTDPSEPQYQGDGSEANPYTVSDVLQIVGAMASGATTSQEQCVRGYITEITEISTKYGNATFKIAEEQGGETTFLIFRCYDQGNKKFTAEDALKVGDLVVVKGLFTNYKGNTPETVQNKAYILSVNEFIDGISSLTLDASDEALYDLRGQRVLRPTKPGVYVLRGRKVVVR